MPFAFVRCVVVTLPPVQRCLSPIALERRALAYLSMYTVGGVFCGGFLRVGTSVAGRVWLVLNVHNGWACVCVFIGFRPWSLTPRCVAACACTPVTFLDSAVRLFSGTG